ncbi:MAG: alpha/beta hydrolase [bacterium]
MQRTLVRTLAAIAPRAAEALLVDRFCTPARHNRAIAQRIAEPWFLPSGDDRLAVYSAGFGPRVLFVHGWEGRAHDFASMATEFRSEGFSVVAFDLPAHGRSTGRRTTLPQLAHAVSDVARASGPFDVVIGHSLGAVATLLALRDGLDARCAVMIAPPRNAPYFLRHMGRVLGLSEHRIAGAKALLERSVGPLELFDTDCIVRDLAVPGVVLHDRDDRQVPFADGAAVAAAWPGARLVELNGLGHRRVLDSTKVHRDILQLVWESQLTVDSARVSALAHAAS